MNILKNRLSDIFFSKKNKQINTYIKLFIVFIFIMFVAVQADKKFALDEIDFPIVSDAASQTMKPIYYRGESSPQHMGIYHPTLYINSLALFIRTFGFSEVSVRFFGVLCTLISAYLLIIILRQLIDKNKSAENLLLGLFLLNPYTIANTTLPDIDSTVLPVLLLLFIYSSLKYLLQKKDMSNKVILILGSLFGLALWSKLTTPLIIPVFLLILAFITSRDYKKSILFTAKSTILGILLFTITYFIYCKIIQLPFSYTFTFLLESFTKGTSTDGPLIGVINNIQNIQRFVFWPTIPIVGLYIASFFGIIFNKNKNEYESTKKLLVSTSLVVTFFYIALIAPFGGFFKYPFPVFGLLILSIVFFYDQQYRNTKIKVIYPILAVAIGFVAEHILLKDSMFKNATSFDGFILLFISIAVFFMALKTKKYNKIAATVLVIAIFFSIGFQASISRVQALAPYPTKYEYGQMGIDQVKSYLEANTSQDEVIWSMKDVGYYVNNRYHESYEYYFNKKLEDSLIKMIEYGKVRYYVVTTGIGQDNIDYYTDIKQILDKYATRVKQFDNFIIYKSKDSTINEN